MSFSDAAAHQTVQSWSSSDCTAFWLAQCGEDLVQMLTCCGYRRVSLIFFSYLIPLFFLFLLWAPGDVRDSCGLVIMFYFFFLTSEFSTSPGFTSLTLILSLPLTPPSPSLCVSLLFPAFLPAGPALWTRSTVHFLLLVALCALF